MLFVRVAFGSSLSRQQQGGLSTTQKKTRQGRVSQNCQRCCALNKFSIARKQFAMQELFHSGNSFLRPEFPGEFSPATKEKIPCCISLKPRPSGH